MPESDTPRTARGPHSKALTRMLRATGLLHMPEEAMLLELLRDLAAELDNGAGARTRTAYLSALKDLRRALDGGRRRAPRAKPESTPAAAPKPAAATATTDDPTSDAPPPPNSLVEFKLRKGIST
ncbi:MAG: hypothetical protein PIR02_16000 [Microbacterium enclense]